ncbi:hypothetical protein [Kitasatospora sp. DSM 101779]|uniref:hypothetical protein n=1 Tax=Kitasatospora sp. DSM 101779 TaxID=2853165 RepID=UPI0021D87634|nr:hypothetical protein [Kitasatospora sp. DSM 101779]MCU7826141.1 hypothetical protein [Kitasatospora sp. DSM 101779]
MAQHTDRPATERPAALLGLAAEALRCASAAALGTTSGAAVDDAVIAAERALQPLRDAVEQDAAALLARSAPEPAGTLALLARVHLGADVQQLGELARRITETAAARGTRGPLPADLRRPLETMAALGLAMLATAARSLPDPRSDHLADLHGDRTEMARHQSVLYARLLDADPPPARADTVDAVLLSGHYDGCAHHALSAARHAALFAGR